MAFDFGSIINAAVNLASSSMMLGATIHTNQTNQAIANATNKTAAQQNRDNNNTAIQLAQSAAQQQQNVLDYQYDSQKLGQIGSIPWMWFIGGFFFLCTVIFIGFKAFKD